MVGVFVPENFEHWDISLAGSNKSPFCKKSAIAKEAKQKITAIDV
jgi:hypothetical protein